jgi:hypothetical protein
MEYQTIQITPDLFRVPWYLRDDVRLGPVRERVARGLQWLKLNVPEWKTKDYRAVSSVAGTECILTAAVGMDSFDAHMPAIHDAGGLMHHGFNAHDLEDDGLVVEEWQRVLRAEGVLA